MATGTGFATIDFGSFPGSNEAVVQLTGVGCSSASGAEAFIEANDSTTDHTEDDHKYIGLWLSLTAACFNAFGGTLQIYGRSDQKLQGTFALRYVWADF